MHVTCQDCLKFAESLEDSSVDLVLMDPPYYSIVDKFWDNQWNSTAEYVGWMLHLLRALRPKLKPAASLVMFGGLGKHDCKPLFRLMLAIEEQNLLTYRNMITWGKRRAYGKSHDYLFTREEIVWYSVSSERTEVTFNVPYLTEKRGYAGYNKNYPAKSEYRRVSNVWTDITELFKPERTSQKPVKLMRRLIETHSNPGDLVIDPFVGYGTTGIACAQLGRSFLGSEIIAGDAELANQRILATQPDK